MSTANHGQPVDGNNLGQKAVRQLAHDLNRFNEVLRTLELRRMGLGTAATDETSAIGPISDEEVLEYFASVDAVYGKLDTEPEDSKPMFDDAHAKPLPGTRPRKVVRKPAGKTS